jgi:hypothetical protein
MISPPGNFLFDPSTNLLKLCSQFLFDWRELLFGGGETCNRAVLSYFSTAAAKKNETGFVNVHEFAHWPGMVDAISPLRVLTSRKANRQRKLMRTLIASTDTAQYQRLCLGNPEH